VEVDQLPPEEAEQVKGLAAKLKSSGQPELLAPSRARDATTYSIVIDDDGERFTFKQRDAQMTREFSAVLNWLEDHLSPAKGKDE
jgi:hypothetical protein